MAPRQTKATNGLNSVTTSKFPRIGRSLLLLISIFCFASSGCGSGKTTIETTDAARNNRLALINRDTSTFFEWIRGQQFFDFDSLVWRTNSSGKWHDRVIITKRAFQGTSPFTRWIADIHGIDPTNGTAIIKVAEGNAPQGSRSVQYVYSWREWSLLTNSQVRLIRVCANPFEKFETQEQSQSSSPK